MPVSKAKQRAVNKYIAKTYDRVNVVMPKGQKADIQSAAALVGQSVNAYINQAIQTRMESEQRKATPQIVTGTKTLYAERGLIEQREESQ